MKIISRGLVKGLLRFRIVVMAAIFGATIFFAMQLPEITMDNNSASAIPDTLKENVNAKLIQEKFNTSYSTLFTVQFPDSLSLREKIELTNSWAKDFKDLKVQGQPALARLAYLGGLKVPVKGGMLGFKNVPILQGDMDDEAIRTRIKENSSITKSFISEDETTFLMLLYAGSEKYRHKMLDKVIGYTANLHDQGFDKTYITGATATSWYLNRDMKKDFMMLLPFSVILSVILLYLIFHRIRYVLAPLIIIIVTVIWVFGIMALKGIPLNVLTTIIPLILFPVGIADAIHVIKTYKKHRKSGHHYHDSFVHTFEELLSPIMLTSITTFIGFSSFVLSDISWTRYFGFFTGLGVMLALIFTVLLLPILLRRDGDTEALQHEHNIIHVPFMEKLVFQTPWAKIFLVAVVIFAAALITPDTMTWKKTLHIPSLHFEGNPITFFSNSHDVKVSDQIIEDKFGGTRFFDIMIESDTPFNDSTSWDMVAKSSMWIEKQAGVGNVFSLYSIINRTSELMNGRPLSAAGVKMLLGDKPMVGKAAKEVMKNSITEDKKAIKITLMCKNIPQFNYTKLATKIENHLEKQHPQWTVTAGGQALLLDSMILLLINTQVVSLSVTFVLIALVLMILYRSIRVGLYTTLPIILASLFIAALMSLFGITINTVTIIVINSSIGIGIDYAIHFTSGYIHISPSSEDNKDALLQTIREKGNVIIFNTLAVGIGFLTLLFSSFPPVRHLGLFIFLSMAVSSTFSLLFLPLFLHAKHSKHLDH